MLRKERVAKAIVGQETDIVPYQLNMMPDAMPLYMEALGTYDLDEAIGNHMGTFLSGSIYGIVSEPFGNNKRRDEWGAIWEAIPETGAQHILEHPLKTPSLKGYKFPDPHKTDRFDMALQWVDFDRDCFLLASPGNLFESAYTIRGMEDLFVDMAKNPSFVHELLDKVLEFTLAILERSLEYPIDGVYVPDDYAAQANLLMSPKMWRTFIKPRLVTLIERTHDAGLPFILHSDGNITALLKDLVDIGIDVLHPIQEEALDIYWVKKEYGKDICLYGGVGEQGVLSFGTPEQVADDVRHKLEVLGKGGGFILTPGINILAQFPVENVEAMIDVLRNQFN